MATTTVLKRHIEAVHEKKRPFECTVCHERFGQKAHLVTHMKGKHKTDSWYSEARVWVLKRGTGSKAMSKILPSFA